MDRSIHVVGTLTLVGVLVVIVSLFWTPECTNTRTRINYAHTGLLLSQICEEVPLLEPGTSEAEFIKMVQQMTIDWNSCQCDGDRLLDPWQTEIQVVIDQQSGAYQLRSAGADCAFDTEDDIVRVSAGPNKPNKSQQ